MTEAAPAHDSQLDGAGAILTIDLGALADNWRALASEAAPAECAAVVKADAYGIGIEHAVPVLWNVGCRTFFVALPDEGRRARAAAPQSTIYVLNGFFADAAELYRADHLRPVLNSPSEVEAWLQNAPDRACAVQVDTGMNRLGLSVKEAAELAFCDDVLEKLNLSLLVSHLSCPDTPEHPANAAQLSLFRGVRERYPSVPASFANSAGIYLGRDFHFGVVRPGIALYGAEFTAGRAPLRTVATHAARVLQIRQGAVGETVGYGGKHRLQRNSRIAIISAGYADGYHRFAGSSDDRMGANVVIRGQSAPILGRVSMDLIATDVTDIPEARPGDLAELFGPNMPIDRVAAAAGTIGYELLTGASRRAKRVYVTAPPVT